MNLLENIGVVSLICVIGFTMFIMGIIIQNQIGEIIIEYKIKTRFKKKPIAKCYCRDCSQFEPETGKCWYPCNTRYMAPSWFCCFADPLTGKKYKEREMFYKNKEDKNERSN